MVFILCICNKTCIEASSAFRELKATQKYQLTFSQSAYYNICGICLVVVHHRLFVIDQINKSLKDGCNFPFPSKNIWICYKHTTNCVNNFIHHIYRMEKTDKYSIDWSFRKHYLLVRRKTSIISPHFPVYATNLSNATYSTTWQQVGQNYLWCRAYWCISFSLKSGILLTEQNLNSFSRDLNLRGEKKHYLMRKREAVCVLSLLLNCYMLSRTFLSFAVSKRTMLWEKKNPCSITAKIPLSMFVTNNNW